MIPAKLKRAGYTSFQVGKWHQGLESMACVPTGRGFDHSYGRVATPSSLRVAHSLSLSPPPGQVVGFRGVLPALSVSPACLVPVLFPLDSRDCVSTCSFCAQVPIWRGGSRGPIGAGVPELQGAVRNAGKRLRLR